MSRSNLDRVTVLGAGVLGGQIAWHSAFRGKTVVAYDPFPEALEKARVAHGQYARIYVDQLGASAADLDRPMPIRPSWRCRTCRWCRSSGSRRLCRTQRGVPVPDVLYCAITFDGGKSAVRGTWAAEDQGQTTAVLAARRSARLRWRARSPGIDTAATLRHARPRVNATPGSARPGAPTGRSMDRSPDGTPRGAAERREGRDEIRGEHLERRRRDCGA